MIAALIIGTLLAVSALSFVLYPVFFTAPRNAYQAPVVPRQSEQDSAVAALREIEFDRVTGKLSDVDYVELKARYTEEAIQAMRREDGASAATASEEDAIEAAVRAYREQHPACPSCGPRPEDDAEFCSNCGRYLHNRCADCGAPVVALDARYCVTCGNRFAA
ncbi:MAG TPA: zinc ribbon domain-containing protein [Gemmatimonadaceae bacterium]|nr:zinc ribbon domain-containing protein [Gemmatimonadaceae bacterium]